jgi:CTP synthase (UTP-ammonia lyase)
LIKETGHNPLTTRIAILGDLNLTFHTHRALNSSIIHCREEIKSDLHFDWIGTDVIKAGTFRENRYSGIWVAPGSPYKDPENVIDAIRLARTARLPVFGNCGGFQHMIIEFARNACGIANAGHEESDSGEKQWVISKLVCSLKDGEEQLTITNTDSRLYRIFGRKNFVGKYFCSYGLNEKYRETLSDHGLRFTAFNKDGEARAMELDDHPFFMGTLFQPALNSTPESPDPLIVEFLTHCMRFHQSYIA